MPFYPARARVVGIAFSAAAIFRLVLFVIIHSV